MSTIAKKILSPGRFTVNVPTPNGWKREEQDISADRIRSWVKKYQEMKDAGISIPAPWRHDLSLGALSAEARTALAEREKAEGSRLNAGFWENLFHDNAGALHGVLDVPLADDYARVGSTVKETSIYAVPKYIDGKGKEWEDVIYHVALVTHPIEPGQENFTKDTQAGKVELLPPVSGTVAENSFSVAMSQELAPLPGSTSTAPALTEQLTAFGMSIDTNGRVLGGPVPEAISILKKFGLTLPESTNSINLAEMILNVGPAVLACLESHSSTVDPIAALQRGMNNGTITEPKRGFAMSATATGFTAVPIDTPQGKALLGMQTRRLTDRLTALVETGRASADYVEKTLKPMLSGCAMSVSIDEQGELGPTSLDHILTALEALPANTALTGKNVKPGQTSVGKGAAAMSIGDAPPNEGNVVIDEEKAEEIVNQVFKNVGYVNGEHKKVAVAH